MGSPQPVFVALKQPPLMFAGVVMHGHAALPVVFTASRFGSMASIPASMAWSQREGFGSERGGEPSGTKATSEG